MSSFVPNRRNSHGLGTGACDVGHRDEEARGQAVELVGEGAGAVAAHTAEIKAAEAELQMEARVDDAVMETIAFMNANAMAFANAGQTLAGLRPFDDWE
jgi:hypothetical protein